MTDLRAAALPALLSTLCCHAAGAQDTGAIAPPALERTVRVFAVADGEELGLPALWSELREADVVFLGETHLDETTHRVELAALRALIEGTDRKVVLAMEMFERDVQTVLDSYLSGDIDEARLLGHARPWGNYRTDYRALVELAKARGVPVIASNAPKSVSRAVTYGGGAAALERLSPELRAFLPPKILPNTRAYWERVARAIRGHMGAGASTDPDENLYSTQCLWDNCMGWSCAQALERWPGCLVLHVNGGFHSAYGDGTVRQLRLRQPDAKVVTVQIAQSDDLARAAAPRASDPPWADYVVVADHRATGLEDGFHAVRIATDLRYRVHVPRDATDAAPVPLLVWLPGDGARAADGEQLWRTALGDEAAIAVVEPPFPQVEADLYQGGRWFFDERFRQDAGVLAPGLARLYRRVLRSFPVDPRRVVLAGVGSGATVVATAKVHSDELPPAAIAVAPRRARKVSELALPDPQDVVPAGPLTVLAEASSRAFWTGEIEAYRSVGIDAELAPCESDVAARFRMAEVAVRAALGLPAPRATTADTVLLLADDTDRARGWAIRRAREHAFGRVLAVTTAAGLGPALDAAAAGVAVRIEPLAFRPIADLPDLPTGVTLAPALDIGALRDGQALPLHPSPFGGTTLLVVPAGASEAERAAWQELAASDAIKRRSRFARLMIAFEDGGASLPEVLESIRATGRRNVLVVPAAFAAAPGRMQRLHELAAPFDDSMSIAWLPGLGARL